MQGIWILLLALQILYCAAFTNPRTYHDELMYGQQLSIMLPTGAEKLEFISMDESQKDVLWSRFSLTKRGIITGRDDNRKFAILSVTFDDQGTYTVLNFWNQKTSIHFLKVISASLANISINSFDFIVVPVIMSSSGHGDIMQASVHDALLCLEKKFFRAKTGTQNCVAGETLSISLGGILSNEATLRFSNQDYSLNLVARGLPVGNSHPEYMGRLKLTGKSIEVLNVNVSDVGNYTLSDRLNRVVKIIYMNLVDHHDGVNAAPFVGLLMLLGVPPCIFCCCRKKICKKNSQPTTTAMNSTTPAMKLDDQMNPPGPPPFYTNPAAPAGPMPAYTPGYPAVGESTVYPPPNPNPTFPPQPPYSGYPATSPAMPPNPAFNPGYPPASGFPPDQPPQWSGAPYNQPASAGFAPVMYNGPAAPEPVRGEINPTTPLLTPPQPQVAQPPAPYAGTNVLNSSDSTVQFNVNMGKDSSSNFL